MIARATDETLTVAAALSTARHALSGVSASARLDAELLLAHCTGLTRAQLLSRGELILDPSAERCYAESVARRALGEPIAYITATAEFWSLTLEVTRDVLVPRADTERLVELALDCVAADRVSSVLDLGTGTGAIAVAIAVERPLASVTAVESSPAALAVAARNVATHAPGRVELIEGDWFAPLTGRRFRAIVANPPYVATGDPELEPHVAAYEPAAALFAGAQGLDALTRIIADAAAHLEPDGRLLLEHGATQGSAVRRLMLEAGFRDVTTVLDLAGHERVTSARAPV